MVVSFEQGVQTNSDATQTKHYSYENLTLKRGELFGWFEMGSTILMFSPKGALIPQVAINQKIKFGEILAKSL
jgi:phosphatidylserine decarboxylase